MIQIILAMLCVNKMKTINTVLNTDNLRLEEIILYFKYFNAIRKNKLKGTNIIYIGFYNILNLYI